MQTLRQLWAGGHLPSCRWVHGFYAGVDAIGDFVGELASSDVPLTNGRGAFSLSLAEYALTAALHFTKQVPRCMANREARVWDKFEMRMLAGQTLGLVGYGDIAKATARLAKAFGMRVVALRRNAAKPDETCAAPAARTLAASDGRSACAGRSRGAWLRFCGRGRGCVDLMLGPYDGEIQPSHKRALLEQSDVVVCSLPGTPATRHFLSTAEFGAMKDDAIFISLGCAALFLADTRGTSVASASVTTAALTTTVAPRLRTAAASSSTRRRCTPRSPPAGCAARRWTSSRSSRCRARRRSGTASGCCSLRTTPTSPTTTLRRAGACGRRTWTGSKRGSRWPRQWTRGLVIKMNCPLFLSTEHLAISSANP